MFVLCLLVLDVWVIAVHLCLLVLDLWVNFVFWSSGFRCADR